MNKIKRNTGKSVLILLIMSALSVSAKTPYEFSIYGGGGYSTFLYRLPANSSGFTPIGESPVITTPPNGLYAIYGVSSSGISGDLGVSFTGFVAPQFGFHVGIGLGLCNVGVNVDSLKTYTSDLIDSNNRDFNMYTNLFDYSETLRMINLSIPLMLQFQTAPNQQSWNRKPDISHGVYAMIGIKLSVLLNNTYESNIATLQNSAYYPGLDNWAATQEFADLGEFKGKSAKGDIGFVQAIFVAELGMKWRVADNMYLYTGAYFDYGLNDPLKNSRKPTSDYIFADDLRDFALLDFSEKTHLITMGVKMRLSFVKVFNQLSCPQFSRF